MSQRCPQDVIEIILEKINGMSENLKKLRYCGLVVAHDNVKTSCRRKGGNNVKEKDLRPAAVLPALALNLPQAP